MKHMRTYAKRRAEQIQKVALAACVSTTVKYNETRYELRNGSVWYKEFCNGTAVRVTSTCHQGNLLCEAMLGKRSGAVGFGYSTWLLS